MLFYSTRGVAGAQASGGKRSRLLSGLGLPFAEAHLSAARPARRGAWATARLSFLQVTPSSRPMCCTSSATLRPIPTGSMPGSARPNTVRRSRGPAACVPLSPTAPSASAGSTGTLARGRKPWNTSPLRTMYREMGMGFRLKHAEAEMAALAQGVRSKGCITRRSSEPALPAAER